MKRIYILIVLFYIILPLKSQVYLGMRDNRFGFVGYNFSNNITVSLEHSVFSEKLNYQQIKALFGYNRNYNHLLLDANIYGGLNYSNYWISGVKLKGIYELIDKFKFKGVINPHYDSGYKFSFCYELGILYDIHNDIALLLQYTDIPVYRMSEKSFQIGALIRVKNLSVQPILSIPQHGLKRDIRVLNSFKYTF